MQTWAVDDVDEFLAKDVQPVHSAQTMVANSLYHTK